MNYPGTLEKLEDYDGDSACWRYAERFVLYAIENKTWEVDYLEDCFCKVDYTFGSGYRTRREAIAAIDEHLESLT